MSPFSQITVNSSTIGLLGGLMGSPGVILRSHYRQEARISEIGDWLKNRSAIKVLGLFSLLSRCPEETN